MQLRAETLLTKCFKDTTHLCRVITQQRFYSAARVNKRTEKKRKEKNRTEQKRKEKNRKEKKASWKKKTGDFRCRSEYSSVRRFFFRFIRMFLSDICAQNKVKFTVRRFSRVWFFTKSQIWNILLILILTVLIFLKINK